LGVQKGKVRIKFRSGLAKTIIVLNVQLLKRDPSDDLLGLLDFEHFLSVLVHSGEQIASHARPRFKYSRARPNQASGWPWRS
jgi:hypothetical protein